MQGRRLPPRPTPPLRRPQPKGKGIGGVESRQPALGPKTASPPAFCWVNIATRAAPAARAEGPRDACYPSPGNTANPSPQNTALKLNPGTGEALFRCRCQDVFPARTTRHAARVPRSEGRRGRQTLRHPGGTELARGRLRTHAAAHWKSGNTEILERILPFFSFFMCCTNASLYCPS